MWTDIAYSSYKYFLKKYIQKVMNTVFWSYGKSFHWGNYIPVCFRWQFQLKYDLSFTLLSGWAAVHSAMVVHSGSDPKGIRIRWTRLRCSCLHFSSLYCQFTFPHFIFRTAAQSTMVRERWVFKSSPPREPITLKTQVSRGLTPPRPQFRNTTFPQNDILNASKPAPYWHSGI